MKTKKNKINLKNIQILSKIRKSGSPQIHKTAHKFDMLNVVIERLMVLYDNFDTSIP